MARTTHHSASRRPRRRLTAHLVGLTTATMLATGLSATTAQAAYDPTVWDRVAQCESGGNWKINTGNGYYGGLQFYHPTWRGFGGQEYASYAHQATKAEQIAIGRRVLHSQGPGAWPVCSVRAGLTKSNGGADPNAQPDDGVSTYTGYVKASVAANVRSGPGTNYSIVGSKTRGTKVTGTLSSGWVKIANNQYMSATTLSDSPINDGVTRYVSASNAANVRSGPGTNYSIVGARDRGAKVTGTISNGWLRIANNQFISTTVLSTNPPGTGNTTRYISANVAANVRSGPGGGYRVVDTIPRGTKVTGTLNSAGWLQIGSSRWVGPTVLSTRPV